MPTEVTTELDDDCVLESAPSGVRAAFGPRPLSPAKLVATCSNPCPPGQEVGLLSALAEMLPPSYCVIVLLLVCVHGAAPQSAAVAAAR